MSKAVTGYMTIDNKFFESQEEADLHERRLNFINTYNYKGITRSGSIKSVNGKDLCNFVLTHSEMFTDLLDIKTVVGREKEVQYE